MTSHLDREQISRQLWKRYNTDLSFVFVLNSSANTSHTQAGLQAEGRLVRMPDHCVVPLCKGNYYTGPKVRVFRFPEEESIRQLWLRAIKREDFVPTKHSKVCELHFHDEDIIKEWKSYNEKTNTLHCFPLKKYRLVANAVPCNFPNWPPNVSATTSTSEISPKSKTQSLVDARLDQIIEDLKSRSNKVKPQHTKWKITPVFQPSEMDSPVDQRSKTNKDEPKSKKRKDTPLSEFSREELEARVLQLEAHNKQLQNLLAKHQGITNEMAKLRKERPFDFSKHTKRHVLLKFAYLGWDYNGFAVQEDTQQTIEAQLFSALLKTRLIESRETSNYHRCGRTDKGVSAFDQVISITLRSRLSSGVGVINDCNIPVVSEDGDDMEINYVMLLNKVLPPEIRMLAWCPVPEGYSARFDCSYRTYKYFFPRGSLDIKLMKEAAQHLVGSHDYRNFCKMDVGNGVVNFCRRIMNIDVCEVGEELKNKATESIKKELEVVGDVVVKEECDSEQDFECIKEEVEEEVCDVVKKEHDREQVFNKIDDTVWTPSDHEPLVTSNTSVNGSVDHHTDGYDMCVATIIGQAFLWHQVRAIMAILFLVGERKEPPGIIQDLLDVQKHPRKPQYCLASDIPLNLYETTFDGISWHWDHEVLRLVISQLQALWTQHSVRTTMIRHMLWDLQCRYKNQVSFFKSSEEAINTAIPQDQIGSLVPGAKTKVYRPLLSRPTCESLETRVEHYVKRQRLDPDILQKVTGQEVSIDNTNSCNSNITES